VPTDEEIEALARQMWDKREKEFPAFVRQRWEEGSAMARNRALTDARIALTRKCSPWDIDQ